MFLGKVPASIYGNSNCSTPFGKTLDKVFITLSTDTLKYEDIIPISVKIGNIDKMIKKAKFPGK